MTDHQSVHASTGSDHANGDADHERGVESAPGPIDWGAWLVSIVGLAAGAAIALVLAQSIAYG